MSSSAIAIARIDERAESPVPAIKIATSAKKNAIMLKNDVEDRVVIVSDDSGEQRRSDLRYQR